MKQTLTILCLCISLNLLLGQSTTNRVDSRSSAPGTVVRIDGPTPSGWMKNNDDSNSATQTQTVINENVSFFSSPDGIVISINNGSNKIKLYALTGQLLFNGELSKGRFLIQTRKGIYFLKINNNSYKVICK